MKVKTEGQATIRELKDALVQFCEQHPEAAGAQICIATEGGYCGVKITSPIIFYGEVKYISIHSSDDSEDIDTNDYELIYNNQSKGVKK